jgi:CubicO group peptidase (beta-lactamase class C family)
MIVLASRGVTLAAALLLAVPAPLPSQATKLPRATPEAVGMSGEKLGHLGARVQEHIDAGLIAGAVTLVAREGKVVHLEARGHRDREGGAPMDVDDLFVIMSMTKPIVSTALMMLYEEGRFLLSDPISRWLPEYGAMAVHVVDGEGGSSYVPAVPITVRHVLTHTAGLSIGRGAPPAPTYVGDTWVNPSPAARPDPADSPLRAAVRQMATAPLNFQPGERWQYGSATDVVAALVEIISGEDLDSFLTTRIFQPLGMVDTHYNVPREKWSRRARVYEPQREKGWGLDPRPVTDPRPTQLFGGVAGLSSTAADYFRFAQMVLNGGELDGARLLSPTTVNLMISNHIGGLQPGVGRGPGYGFGLGYSVLTDVGLSRESLSPGSFGWGGAWGTYYISDPAEDLIAIFMVQITSYGHLNLRHDIGTIATSSIIRSRNGAGQKVRPHEALR